MIKRNTFAYVLLICLMLSSCASGGDYQSGYDDGYAEGKEAGYKLGLADSDTSTYEDISDEAYQMGYESGLDDGYSTGYDDGYTDGIKETGYTEAEYQRYAQDRVDAVVKELFAGQINPFTGTPVESEEDYREYITEYRKHLYE